MNQDMYPFVSVIVPEYNEARSISRCLDSIRNQRYPRDRIEIIVVDDGSTDESSSIASTYNNVRVIYQANSGPSAARNAGVRFASGDLVAFLDADDVVEDRWLAEAVPFFANRDVAAAGFLEKPLNELTDIVWFIWLERHLKLISSKERTDHLGASGCIYRKDVLLDVGCFDTKLLAAEDVDLSNRIIKKGYHIFLIRKQLLLVEYPNNLYEYFYSQLKKSAFLVLFYSRSSGTSGRFESSYSNLCEYIQSLFPYAFLLVSIFFKDLYLVTLFLLLFFLLILLNRNFMAFAFHRRTFAKHSAVWPAKLILYLLFRSFVWGLGLIFGCYLIAGVYISNRRDRRKYSAGSNHIK
jgi:glycosyltransferase involved in cell wall biosynthesis